MKKGIFYKRNVEEPNFKRHGFKEKVSHCETCYSETNKGWSLLLEAYLIEGVPDIWSNKRSPLQTTMIFIKQIIKKNNEENLTF